MSNLPLHQETAEAIRNTTIGVGGVTYTLFGLPFSDWAAIATVVFMTFQAIVLLPKVWGTLLSFVRKFR